MLEGTLSVACSRAQVSDMRAPRLTIVLRVFNNSATLKRAVMSCFHQTVPVRVVVVDDGSTDNWQSTLSNEEALKISVVRHPRNLGTAAALNTGIEACESELVGFLDADDELLPNFAEYMVGALDDNPLAGFAYCTIVNGPRWHLEGSGIFAAVLRQGFLCPPGTLVIRSELAKSLPILPSRGNIGHASDVCEDDRLCFELCRENSVVLVKTDLYRSIGSPTQVTSDHLLWAKGWHQLISDYAQDISSFAGKRVLYFHLGRVTFFYVRAGFSTSAGTMITLPNSGGGWPSWVAMSPFFFRGFLSEASRKPRKLVLRFLRRVRGLLASLVHRSSED